VEVVYRSGNDTECRGGLTDDPTGGVPHVEISFKNGGSDQPVDPLRAQRGVVDDDYPTIRHTDGACKVIEEGSNRSTVQYRTVFRSRGEHVSHQTRSGVRDRGRG